MSCRKNCIITVVLIAVFGLAANAADLTLFIKSGFNLASMYGDYFDDLEDSRSYEKKLKPGFIGGLALEIRPIEVFAFQPELLFSMKGATYSNFPNLFRVKLNHSVNYMEIPLLLKYLVPGRPLSMNFYTGFAPAFLLSSQLRTTNNGVTLESDLSDDTNPVDVGMPFGGGFDVRVGAAKVFMDIRYTIGLLEVYEGSLYDEMHNGTISIVGGFGFDL